MTNISRGLSNIAREILEDAQKEAEALLLKAGSEGKNILNEAKAEAERKYAAVMNKNQEDLEIKKQEIANSLDVETRNEMLNAREKLVEQVFAKAQDRLKEYASSDNYLNCLSELISETTRRISSDKLMVKLNKRDQQRLGEKQLQALSKKLKVELVKSDELIDSVGGVIVSTFDGRIVMNNTFESRLEMLKPVLRGNVAKMLFEEESESQRKEQ